MRTRGVTVAGATWVAALTLNVFAARQEPPAAAYRPPPPPEQPVAFSHQAHVAQGLACATCHAGAETTDRATLPPTATCMGCHSTVRTDSAEIRKLAGFHAKQADVPWRRVYRLPEFVYFSHAVHAPADKSMTCESCHGAVRELVVMQKLKDTSMASCVECHTARAAPTRCDSCHEAR